MSRSPAEMEQAFLDDIVAHPEDPSLWLILSDWLTERDDPRAELVRLTWQLQYEPDHDDFPTRQARVQELIAGGMLPVRPRRKLEDFEFVWIAPGSFLMGSPEDETDRDKDEKQHLVTLTRGFWFGIHTITQGQWQSVTGENPSTFRPDVGHRGSIDGLAESELEHLPVENISWTQTQKYLAQLSRQLGVRLRFPTEAQWEYACRAGTTSPFHFGATLDGTQASCDSSRNGYGTGRVGTYLMRPAVVGSYLPNPWGLYDMHGNVWEWCQDWYQPDFDGLPEVDPVRKTRTKNGRVARGGCWAALPFRCRAAARYRNPTRSQCDIFGLRLCCPG
jgi:uncharacterized protein (TIGR02996 family)